MKTARRAYKGWPKGAEKLNRQSHRRALAWLLLKRLLPFEVPPAFAAVIREDFEADAPWLILADWLEARGGDDPRYLSAAEQIREIHPDSWAYQEEKARLLALHPDKRPPRSWVGPENPGLLIDSPTPKAMELPAKRGREIPMCPKIPSPLGA